ncbi:MAG: MFS transporter [Oxalobacter sp.]|nr:MAG: MFS transporter [Oxalobacter sp.]
MKNTASKVVLPPTIAAAFFLSGAAGLIYQIAWQRLLFANFGVDIESITVVVSAFMLGLGCGGYLGGRIADRYFEKSLLLFCLFEAFIGCYGIVSPYFIEFIGQTGSSSGLFTIAVLNFFSILPATVLMGGTLPMLTAWLAKKPSGVGNAIGILYFCNTLGAAIGCFATAFVLFMYFDLYQVIWMAAASNFIVAVLAYVEGRRYV